MTDERSATALQQYRIGAGRTAWRSVDSEGVVLDLRHSVYFRLNRSGQSLWSLLVNGCTAEDLVQRLVADRSVQRDRAIDEVTHFLAAIDEQGLFEDAPAHG